MLKNNFLNLLLQISCFIIDYTIKTMEVIF